MTSSKPAPRLAILIVSLLIPLLGHAQGITLDERPARSGEWGYHPAEGALCQVNPPNFTWRPQSKLTWEIQCIRQQEGNAFTSSQEIAYSAASIEFNVHTPPKTLEPGPYSWRYRGKDSKGGHTNWSQARRFTISPDATAMPLPPRAELLARIPATHPRLFLRPENLPRLKQLAKGDLKDHYDGLVSQCERILRRPPSTKEPAKYSRDMKSGSDPWRDLWWGNRGKTQAALGASATLAFTRLLGGSERYGQEAKRILLECAKWDPKGATGYRYNDEAGMPYAYYFSRTYSFLNDLLSEEEKVLCRKVMKIRGEEMYNHLYPRQLWEPYASHSNRAWHFLGEVGIAFAGEIEGAEDWVWFAANVFYNVYPVWSDEDGGWHEGSNYWSSYQTRFTWWADVMREALQINAYDKPYYSKAGYYMLYLMPPGKVGGGFGDLTAGKTSSSYVPLMTTLAAQSGNPHWQWWVENAGGKSSQRSDEGYIGFIRGALPHVPSVSPSDLPTSRLFRGTGQAYLNSTLADARDGVQIAFKSSPFGLQSHGYEANNAFLLSAYGKRLLIRSGRRDSYGSEHHRKWMWSTRSVNSITFDGHGQRDHASDAKGQILAFKSTPSIDAVSGEAGPATGIPIAFDSSGNPRQWQPGLDRFTRTLIFVKPDLLIVYDRLASPKYTTYEYNLHALNRFDMKDQHRIQIQNDQVLCDIDLLAPDDLSLTQTNQYDPNPRPRVTLREWHLTARKRMKAKTTEFIALYRPHRSQESVPTGATLARLNDAYALEVPLSDGGRLSALLPIASNSKESQGKIRLRLRRNGKAEEVFEME